MKIKITLVLFIISLSLFSQPWLNSFSEKKINQFGFNEHKAAFDAYWKDKQIDNGYYFEDGVKAKAYGWKQYKRWENYWSTRVDPETGKFPSSEQMANAEAMYKALSQNKSVTGEWTNLGPVSSTGGYAGVGRLNCIAFHPSESNTFWVGAPTGGLWKTIDGGQNWSVLTDGNNVLGVSAVAVPSDYATSQIIYIGTGDRDSWRHDNGEGVLKSTDGGLTWNSSLFFDIASSYTVNQILIHPSNNDILYAATTYGIYKTTDAGDTWTLIYQEYFISDLEFKPGDPSVLYASNKRWGKIYKLTNDGTNVSVVYDGNEDGAKRIELAVSPSNPNLVYAVVGNSSGGLKGIYKSINSGANFALVTSLPNILANNVEGTGASGQAWYDLALIVDPLNEDVLYCGGVNTWKSTDGGVNWEINNFWTSYYCSSCVIAHADKHFFDFNGTTLYEGNDGGLYKSEDGVSWESISNGIVNSQMYRIAVSQQNSEITLTGLQDNGTKMKNAEGVWLDKIGGDGMNCEIDPSDDNFMFGSAQNGRVIRTTNGSSFYTDITKDGSGNPIHGLDETGAWLTPYVIDPNSTSTLYLGLLNVWKSENRGDSWSKISTINNEEGLETIGLSASNDQVIYTAENEQIWKTINGGATWTDVSTNLPASFITSITIKHDDPNTVWLTLGTYNSDVVYQTINGGSSWTNISTGLPYIPANTIIQNTQNLIETELYVGTDFGVYVKVGAENWALFNTGMPKVAVTDLDIYYDANPDNSVLRAGTWGRGLWESDLYTDPIDFSVSSTESCINSTVELNDMSTNIPTSWIWLLSPATGFNFVNGTNANSENPEIEFTQVGVYSIQLTAFNENGSYVLLKPDYIQVNALPDVLSLIDGANSICESAEEIYMVAAIDGLTYNWTLPEGWSGNSSTNSISIVSNDISGSISLTAQNNCGISPEQNISIEVTALPTVPEFEANLASLCEDVEAIYSVISTPDYTYEWTLPETWSGNSISHSISLTPDESSGIINVVAVNACGNSAAASTSINVSRIPGSPIFIDPVTDLCSGVEMIYTIENEEGATYYWTIPEDWTGSSSIHSIEVVNDGNAGILTVYAENECGTSESESLEIINVNVIPDQPSIMSGEVSVCEGDEVFYSVESVEGLSYIWTLPNSWTGDSDVNSISTIVGDVDAVISVQGFNACGAGVERSKNVSVNLWPVANFTYVEDMATLNFTNLSEEADSYIWNFGDEVESTEIHPEHTYDENGTFTISLKAENECSNHIFEVDVNIINIGMTSKELEDISLFPNPSKGVISVIGLKKMSCEIEIFDLTGRNLIHKAFDAQNSISIDLSRYADGAYQIVIKQGDLHVKKLVILQK